PNYPHNLRARAAPCQVRAAAIPPRRGGDRFTAPSAAGPGVSALPEHGRPAGAPTSLGRRGRPRPVAWGPVPSGRAGRALRGESPKAALTPGRQCDPPRLRVRRRGLEAPRRLPYLSYAGRPRPPDKKLATRRRNGIPAWGAAPERPWRVLPLPLKS